MSPELRKAYEAVLDLDGGDFEALFLKLSLYFKDQAMDFDNEDFEALSSNFARVHKDWKMRAGD